MNQERVHRLKVATLLFKGTSDDLLFWTLIDTLFLTAVKGLTITEVSLAFTVSFWVALLFKPVAYACIKRMQVGKAVICSAALFLASALLITFGPTLPLIIAGQCLYEIAPDFFDVLDILLKGLCERDRKGRDYVQSSSFASTLYSVITLIAALLIDPLMSVNPYLPMILCVVVRFFSLPLAIAIHVGTRSIEGLDQGRRVILKGRYFDKATMSYLLMAAFFGAFCMLSISYLKLLLQDNLSFVFDEESVIAIYSYCIIATRVVKILGNAITGTSGMHGAKYSSLSLLLSLGGVFAVSCGLAGVRLSGMPAIVVTAVGLLSIYYVFDPMSDVQSFLSIERLNADQSITAIYIRGLLRELVSAIASTIITVVLAANSYLGAMVLLLAMSLTVLVFGLIGKRYHHLQSGDYAKSWPIEAIKRNDSLVVSAAILMIHYGVVQSQKFNPTVLANRVGQVEHIGSHYPLFRYVGKRPYTFEGLYESFCNGEPSAVLGYRNGGYKWYPVLYVDEDDGVMAGYGEGPLFTEDFEDIKEQCVFSLRPKLQLWAGL